MFGREVAILKHLDGNVSPKLLESGKHEDRQYLLIEWCPGVNASLAAADFRRSADAGNRQRLLQLCCAILDAYARLHAQHVIHSDVHPRNVLVTGDDEIKIIDYGLAQLDVPEHGVKCPNRGGVGFFFEPEYAQAVRAGHHRPESGELGEQYALAALLYLLLTGVHYLEFSIEKHEMLRQIVEDPPLPFSSRGIAAWPEVEHLLVKALSKNPHDRFSSVADFADGLRRIAEPAEAAGSVTPTTSAPADFAVAQALLTAALQRVAATAPLMAFGLQFAPTVSVTYGAAGIAYALYRMACVREDPTLLSLADIWATRGAGDIDKGEAFYGTEIDISPAVVGRVSPYHTASGLHCVQALIGHAMGDMMSEQAGLQAFVAAVSGTCENLDVTLGRSGVLLSGSMLLDALACAPRVDTTTLAARGNEIFKEVWEEIDSFAPILEASEIKYSGIAHGWAGILYATLRWSRSSGTPLPTGIGERLQQLAECAEHIGRGVRWKWGVGGHDREGRDNYMSGWCNGSAGFVHLWTLAHQTFADEGYLALAEKAAWHSWETRGSIGSLCCGLAGQAYGLLNLYRYTGEHAWLHRAKELANRAASAVRDPALRPDSRYVESLYKGELGVALLVAELSRPELACMPFFEGEGWPSAQRN
jgi:serine/threonine-protein kinase